MNNNIVLYIYLTTHLFTVFVIIFYCYNALI